MPKTKLTDLTMTSGATPSQWEGKLDDGRFIYARYRHGHGAVYVAASVSEAIEKDEPLIEWPSREEYESWTRDDPRLWDGVLSTEELLEKLQTVDIDVSEVVVDESAAW